MLPSDILGCSIYLMAQQEFKFIKGPVFSDFIVADEINRAPPRTQSALLEAMEERQVTIEGTRHILNPDFFVMATQNPQEYEGTFQLPEVQMDRFLFKLTVSHADVKAETSMLKSIAEGVLPPDFTKLDTMAFDRAALDLEIQQITLDQSLLDYIAEIINQTRKHPYVLYGSSVRGGIALTLTGRILALLDGRDFVIPDDIKALCHHTLRHRIKLNSEAQLSGIKAEDVLDDILQKTGFPG
ncbi:MAG: MoxR family ATPase [Deltaproteobacteria bacterium]|nr:MoxR family ATPase [Deltaproteobacteria bacterium]